MTDGPAPHELSERIARLEERMKTMQAEYRSDLATLAKDIADRNAEAADRSASAADRMARWGWWQVGITIAAIGFATGLILHFLSAGQS